MFLFQGEAEWASIVEDKVNFFSAVSVRYFASPYTELFIGTTIVFVNKFRRLLWNMTFQAVGWEMENLSTVQSLTTFPDA